MQTNVQAAEITEEQMEAFLEVHGWKPDLESHYWTGDNAWTHENLEGRSYDVSNAYDMAVEKAAA